MNTHAHHSTRRISAGFTLPEVMMATFIFGSVMAAILGVYVVAQIEWKDTTLAIDTTHNASITMERIIYGQGVNLGLRSAEAASVTATVSAGGWELGYRTCDGMNHRIKYDGAQREILYGNSTMDTNAWVTLGRNISDSSVQNATNGLHLSLTVSRTDGKYSSQASMNTFALYRN